MIETMDMMFTWSGGSVTNTSVILLSLLLSVTIGHVVAWSYSTTHQGLSYSQSFVASLVVMPVLVCLVMLLMADNLVIAFGLLAVFAVVRFRNVLKDTRDTTFILWTIVEGMAAGTMRFQIAIIGAVMVTVIVLYLRYTQFGGRHRYDVVVNLQLGSGATVGQAFYREVLGRHALRITLAGDRQRAGQGRDLSFRILLRDPSRADELLGELERLQGVTNVNVFRREDESEI
jgi:predicted signal transduction protein with EAL and GGDEF domain